MSDPQQFDIPTSLAVCADRLYETRQKRLDMQREVDLVKSYETALTNHIIENLPKSEASGIAGRIARASIVNKSVPQVKDWDAFYQHIAETKQFDLLQRRAADKAVEDRWDLGEEVPGVERFTVVKVSLNKV